MHYGDKHMKNEDDNVIEDIHQAELYRRFACAFPIRSEGDHGICDMRISLGISADRALLSKHKPKNEYAILPVLLSIVNWPIWVRNKEKYLLLSSVPPIHSHNPTLYFGKPKHTYTHINIHTHAHTHTHTHTHTRQLNIYVAILNLTYLYMFVLVYVCICRAINRRIVDFKL